MIERHNLIRPQAKRLVSSSVTVAEFHFKGRAIGKDFNYSANLSATEIAQ